MNYRIFLSEYPRSTSEAGRDFGISVLELFTEIDGTLYRVNKELSVKEELQSKINKKKMLMGEMFKEIGKMLSKG